jgi:flagellar biosynthetic protein FlhB
MPEESEQGGDRTQAATPRRQQRAREAGQVPLSREATHLAVLTAGGMVLWLAGPTLAEATLRRLAVLLDQAFRLDPEQAAAIGVMTVGLAALPVGLAAVAAAIAATFAQTGLLVHGAALAPKFSRVNPGAGLKRLFGWHGLSEASRATLKLGVLVLAGKAALAPFLPGLPTLLWQEPAALTAPLFAVIVRLGTAALGVQAAFAALDLVLVRWRHIRSLRMSREEVRQEQKETDGDPAIKNRLKRLRLARARRRMLAAVPKATVVVTNPTHYAVALFYQRVQGGAPRVTAKGIDFMADRIRETALAHRVPLVANPPLARALYTVELDAEIPAEHFQAVAEIIAYIWGLDRRSRARL